MDVILRTMGAEDVDEVINIEREAFSPLWPGTSFRRQLNNRYSAYLVAAENVEDVDDLPAIMEDEADSKETFRNRLVRIARNVVSKSTIANSHGHKLSGYVGIWFQGNESHITEIAVREEYRGQGIGELLLIGSILAATRNGSTVVTLEVRMSNFIAQRLYEKYGFSTAGIRKGYYSDNREDALIMTTNPIHTSEYRSKFIELQELFTKRRGKIEILD
ncbi:MAG: ribosomal protein S18-alanine N-acetyltransferase [Chloroflexota bacterium]|nr:ribosomal protein S18-alanine N-acetyltransferase [Chloroflexota bacterium]